LDTASFIGGWVEEEPCRYFSLKAAIDDLIRLLSDALKEAFSWSFKIWKRPTDLRRKPLLLCSEMLYPEEENTCEEKIG